MSACPRPAPPTFDAAPPQAAKPIKRFTLPEWVPSTLFVDDYVGAAACGACHAKEWKAWQRSPHGRGMAPATPASVLGAFDGKARRLDGGTVTPLREGDRYSMDIGGERYPVDLVLGSGRQHQVYLTHNSDGSLQLLPVYWATQSREWVLESLLLRTSLSPQSPTWWRRQEVITDGICVSCHLSQGRTRTDGKRVETTWVDLPINCESCHGPGRAHVTARAPGAVPGKDNYRDLHALGKAEEVKVCARCHSVQHAFTDAAWPDQQYLTLASGFFRADATQWEPSYQYAGHASSECYLRGELTCSHCHDPHTQHARALDGGSAEGKLSDHQCTVCHRDLAAAAPARAHAHHKAARCVDCHMPLHSIKDTVTARQRVSDHAISIPRPRESIEFQVPNACDGCHADKGPAWELSTVEKWGKKKAATVRPWVRAFALFRGGGPGAKEAMIELLRSAETGDFARASALDALATMPSDASLVPLLQRTLASDDPVIRGNTLRALWNHDAGARNQWLIRAAFDQHPLVRSAVVSYAGLPPLSDEGYEEYVSDLARQSTLPPGLLLQEMALENAQKGNFARAIRLVDGALARGTPLQIERLQLPALRSRLLEAEADQRRATGR